MGKKGMKTGKKKVIKRTKTGKKWDVENENGQKKKTPRD